VLFIFETIKSLYTKLRYAFLCVFAAGIVLSQKPGNVQEQINETATMICAASAPPNVDVVYVWTFNGYPIDFKLHVEYRMVS
jgi:hypothetical protein